MAVHFIDQDSSHRSRPGLLWLLIVVAAVAMVTAACTSDGEISAGDETSSTTESTTVGENSPTTTQPPEDILDYLAAETIKLSDCPDAPLQCGTVTVPVDHEDESAGTIDIAVAIHRATSPEDRIGYLLINPGGPGESGVEYAFAAAAGPGLAFTQEVLERFDIVGFDPRGVGRSEPRFECGARGEQLALLNQIEGPVDTDEEIALGERAVALCVESMGPAAARLGSESVARDMDEIRKALGAEQINYFGASYGSTLGTWYATLFPDRVRAMVVDGADNPVDDLSSESARLDNAIDEVRQFEALLNEALLACASARCPIFNDGDPIGFYLDRVDDLGLVNEAFGGDKTAGPLGIINPLYSEATWPELWNGLAALEKGDAQPLIDQAAQQLGEVGEANFTGHVNCLDQWSLQPQFDRETQLADTTALDAAAVDELPLLSAMSVLDATDPCPFFDTLTGRPLGRPLDGSDVPILVIGNPSDPATPFTESVELVESTLGNGYLVEVDHPSHVVYPANSCVNELIHAVLIDVSFPVDTHTVCPAEEPAQGGDGRPVGEAELTELLSFICLDSAAEGTELAGLEATCEAIVNEIVDTYSFDQIVAAIQGQDDDVLQGLGQLLENGFEEAGIAPAPDAE